MFPDYLDVEMKYVKDTGIYPIMHAVAFRREIVERNPWVAANLFKAFDEARRRSVERALNNTSSALPLPWGYEFARRMQDIVGKDLMPYGVEANRTTLDAFLQYGHEQGVLSSPAHAGGAVSAAGAEELSGFRTAAAQGSSSPGLSRCILATSGKCRRLTNLGMPATSPAIDRER